MNSPESLLGLPEEQLVTYLDGTKDFLGEVAEFEVILRLKPEADFGGFSETIEATYPDCGLSLHVCDPNWFEEGKYTQGVIEPRLLEDFERFFKFTKLIDNEDRLKSLCYFSRTPRGGIRGASADLIINVENKEYDEEYDGLLLMCYLVEGSEPFELDENPTLISALKEKAASIGKSKISYEEYIEQKSN